ncbi:MAG: TonB family protein [Rikenellaceae bacterium]|jgi:TonB family protein|nr:TonB family protein [Rikenellaceae bacterium]
MATSLLEYIRSDRRGPKAHRIELEAMGDALLHSAIEGLDAVDGDHEQAIERLRQRIGERVATVSGRAVAEQRGYVTTGRSRAPRPLRRRVARWSFAAGLLLCVATAGLLLYLRDETPDAPLLAEILECPSGDSLHMPLDMLAYGPALNEALAEAGDASVAEQAEQLTVPVVVPDAKARDEAAPQRVRDRSAANAEVKASHVAEPVHIAEPEHVAGPAAVEGSSVDEVVVAGYGTSVRSATTGAVAAKDLSSESKTEIGANKVQTAEFDSYVAAKISPQKDSDGNTIKGTVTARFTVDAKGRVTDLQILTPLSPKADKEARRLITKYRRWAPTTAPITVTIPFE